jgi:hypothetical protein
MQEAVRRGWTLDDLRGKRDNILRVAARRGAFHVRVFGSVARGEAGHESDIDFLVDFRDDATLWDVVGLWQDLSDLFECDVDVVTEKTLKRWVRPHVLKDAVSL